MSINVKQNGQNADMVTFVLEKQISEILGTPSNNHSSSFDVRGSPESKELLIQIYNRHSEPVWKASTEDSTSSR
ncbi:hypothetical protein HOLleu_36147 [Holothuria leucospilota]|uniref:Uncharacterized protein n=1 Tax=Holothuria leucospilota TaxID=206669 RepID=A0A9Q0YNW9_HOLLE|nr:hypothetical protein HOLleu_36147 [Holothuria leucospilota]